MRGQTITHAELDETDEVFDVQLLHQAAAVSLRCLGGDNKDSGYLYARFALNE